MKHIVTLDLNGPEANGMIGFILMASPGGGPAVPGCELLIPSGAWANLGSPRQLTVTVAPSTAGLSDPSVTVST